MKFLRSNLAHYLISVHVVVVFCVVLFLKLSAIQILGKKYFFLISNNNNRFNGIIKIVAYDHTI